MSSRMITRHGKAGILMHWFNAVSWLFLVATGLGLIQNPALQPLGQWWPNAVRPFFGGAENLLLAHWVVGAVWAGVWIVFVLVGIAGYTVPFLRQIFSYSVRRDVEWMVKKMVQMTLGSKAAALVSRPFGWDDRLPDQEYYNAGQKGAAVAMVAGGIALAVTGGVMVLSKYFLSGAHAGLVQWSITLHFIAAGITFGVLLVHVYMAAISSEERPAFISMFTGKVPETYARHHHKIWYEQVRKQNP